MFVQVFAILLTNFIIIRDDRLHIQKFFKKVSKFQHISIYDSYLIHVQSSYLKHLPNCWLCKLEPITFSPVLACVMLGFGRWVLPRIINNTMLFRHSTFYKEIVRLLCKLSLHKRLHYKFIARRHHPHHLKYCQY